MMINKHHKILPNISHFLDNINIYDVPNHRKKTCDDLASHIKNKVNNNEKIILNFICTHNSRRSIFSQVWFQTISAYFNINNVFCYSSGTLATSIFPKTIETLQGFGFVFKTLYKKENPIYYIKYSNYDHPIIGFSKTFKDYFNPNEDFIAIMTCSQANENCPYVPGAKKIFSITFDDPKTFDDTRIQNEKYKEISIQIATEIFYILYQINSKNNIQ